jgi:hypothetical protein
MAPQLGSLGESVTAQEAQWPDWRAYYVFYHADRNRLLRGLVLPLVRQLFQDGAIDRFFFVRYGLGGPHLRLRWRVTDTAAAGAAETALAHAAAKFFAHTPSRNSLSEEQIRQTNHRFQLDGTLPSDRCEAYPDNTWRRFPAEFEVERYGGPEHLDASLDLFALSSAHVLRRFANQGEGSAWVRTAALRAVLHLAWGFAGDDEALFGDLVGYGPRLMGDDFASCARAGEAVFAKRRAPLVDMVCSELTWLTEQHAALDPLGLAGAACVLVGETGGGGTRRWHFAESHIHMTANRLGLTNAEEVYLSRMLWAAVEAVRREQPETWRRLWVERPAFGVRARGRCLAERVVPALTALAERGSA